MNQNTTNNRVASKPGKLVLTAEVLEAKMEGKEALLETWEKLGVRAGRYVWQLGSRVQRIAARLDRMEEEARQFRAAKRAERKAIRSQHLAAGGCSDELLAFLESAPEGVEDLMQQIRLEVAS